MASKSELEAMGIKAMKCKECCKDIAKEEYNSHKGYCKSCYEDRYNIENNKKQFNQSITNYEEEKTTNAVAKIIKILAILNAIASIILGLVNIENFEIYAILFIVVGIISSLFFYSLGEIIQLLQDIKNKN